MRSLILSALLIAGCASDYKGVVHRSVDPSCISKLIPPAITANWYTASIDVVGKHISGLLLMKEMPDASYRVVFTNEAGVKFLDFEFPSNGEFKVHHIIKQLDRGPVIKLLKKDFELILGIPFRNPAWQAWQKDSEILYGTTQKNESAYFITSEDCASLHRIELRSKRKRMVTLNRFGLSAQQPDSMRLRHHTFAMQINLKKLPRE